MQLQKNEAVYTADGQQIGVIDRVVLDPSTNEISHLVIRQGWLFTEDKVVPIELVDLTDGDRIGLRRDVKNLDQLPPFEEVSYIPYTGDAASATSEPSAADEANDRATTTTYTKVTDAFTLYGYPRRGMGGPEMNVGDYGYPDELYKVKVKRHIPTGTVALQEGAVVVDSQGERVGTIRQIMINEQTKEATHLLIAEGWLFREERLVPINWVKAVTEAEVQLYVKTDVLNQLPAHQHSI